VQIKAGADYDRAVRAIRGVVGTVPGMHASVSTYEGDIQAGVLAPGSKDLTVRVYGQDYSQLHALATDIQGLLAHVGGLGVPRVSSPTMEPNVTVRIDDAKAHDAGVLPGDARRRASTLVSGLTVGNFFEQQAVFDAVVWSIPSARATLQDVRKLPIDTTGGGHIPLASIADVTVGPDPLDIEHQALSRYVDVTVPVHAGNVSGARSAIQGRLSRMGFPLDYHAEILGGSPEHPTSHLKFLTFALAALIGILLLLQAAFGSWRLAAMFFLVLPVTLAGGLIVALVTGQERSLGADAGLLAIVVFAVRQGMLEIAAIRQMHAQDGGELTSAIVIRAAGARFGPALAAVVVACVMLIPFVVLGDVAGNEITHTAAAVMLGGLATATLVNEVLVPAMCLALGPKAPVAVEDEEGADEPSALSSPTPSVT
jgi:Cu/Ag efflux pump CusA